MTGRISSRLALILGGALFGLSFFLPFRNHAPCEEMAAALSAVAQAESAGEGLANGGLAVVIAYPYAWVLLVVAAAGWNFSGARSAWPWLQVGVNTVGNLTLMALCVALIWLDDPWLPAKLQWIGAILPVVILLPIWCAARWAAPERRAWLVIALGLGPQLLFQVLLAFVSVGRAGQAVGFVVGSVGAALALAGSIGSFYFQRSAKVDAGSPAGAALSS